LIEASLLIKARVRGIYSTALTKLLLGHNFEIVQPSDIIKERLRIPASSEDRLTPDIDIYDRLDRQGVNVVGSMDAIETLASILQSSIDDVIFRRRISIFDELDYSVEGFDSNYAREFTRNETEKKIIIEPSQGRLNVEFPFLSKKKLDNLRGMVTPTIDGHHYYKACGGRISSLLDMAERMLEIGSPPNEVENLFKETIRSEYPDVGSMVLIEHVKIDGRVLHLGDAQIIEFDEETNLIMLNRVFTKAGIYDGLRTRKEPGDYAITDLKVGEWIFQTKYFSKDGRYKGTYINLNTPIELYPQRIRYIDLEVDVCLWPDGKVETVDLDELEKKISQGYISKRLGEIIKERLKEVLNTVNVNAEKK